MKRISTAVFALAVGGATVLGFSVSANAAPETKANQLSCFEGGGGDCTRNGGNDFTLANPVLDDYSGVHISQRGFVGKHFSELSLGFSYDGDTSGGSPRFSIPVLESDGPRDGYVFIDAASCNDLDGHVAPRTTTACAVSGYYFEADGTVVEQFYYSSYDAFLAGEGDPTVFATPFVVADQPGTVRVFDIQFVRVPPGQAKK